jgi:hypothetical protein
MQKILKNNFIKLVIVVLALSFTACTVRDKQGNTDANNTNSTKNYTDSTRGGLNGDSALMANPGTADSLSR